MQEMQIIIRGYDFKLFKRYSSLCSKESVSLIF